MSALLGRFYLAHINDTHSHFDETALPLRLALPKGLVMFVCIVVVFHGWPVLSNGPGNALFQNKCR
jgi:hypothetical protein